MFKNSKINKKNKIVVCLIILILCSCGAVYLVFPQKNIEFENINKKNIVEIISNLKNVNIHNKSVSIKLDEVNTSEVIKDITKFEKFKLEFKENKLTLYIPTKVIGFIDTVNTSNFEVSEENGAISLKLIDAYLGKIKIPNSKVLKVLSDNSSEDFTVDEKNEKIYIKNKFINFTKAEVVDDKLNISCELNFNNMIGDFLKKRK
ncbi:hypothetical protein SAMN02745163_04251 [Clostridium cavendishii DSM 21758]|uniref:Uncharacterized protein n=1 Tax=Clostridium cavendishii DSM 21758 TaxID=1121302 RepID=A0A1M6UF42_9CLOT|nr:hypothetical protein [Clostridium cavendishii]SHK67789.1 hypothetical protein SAMN02745163_04251 [Clostridium cavendishii DSM 21758]